MENSILIVNLTATISIIFLADDMLQATSSSQEVIVNRENVELALKRFAKMDQRIIRHAFPYLGMDDNRDHKY